MIVLHTESDGCIKRSRNKDDEWKDIICVGGKGEIRKKYGQPVHIVDEFKDRRITCCCIVQVYT